VLLKNYDILQARSGVQISTTISRLGVLKNYNGSVSYNDRGSWRPPFSSFNQYNNGSTSSSGSILVLGSNNAKESYEDYTISAISNLTFLTVEESCKLSDDELCLENTFIARYYNNNSSSVVVGELGVCSCLGGSSSTSHNWNYTYLIYRKALETPIEVPAHGNIIVKLVLKTPIYPNKPTDYIVSASVE
jgi:hypothetical protein